MPDIGNSVYGQDFPPAVYDQDWTSILNMTSTSYAASGTGIPEVGVAFTAPTSGRALLVIAGGLRNNAANTDRAVLTYRLYEDSSAGNQTVLAQFNNALVSCGTSSSQEYQYGATYDLLENLEPGRQYYVQLAYRCVSGSGTADIASRQVTVIPMP
jgi:hypothetical protein